MHLELRKRYKYTLVLHVAHSTLRFRLTADMSPSNTTQSNRLFTLPYFVYSTLPTIILPTIALQQPNHLIRTATLGLALACYYEAHEYIVGDDVIARYTSGCMIGSLACVAWWFLFEVDLDHATFVTDGVSVAKLPPMKRWQRFVELWHGSRHVGWNIQVVSSTTHFAFHAFRVADF